MSPSSVVAAALSSPCDRPLGKTAEKIRGKRVMRANRHKTEWPAKKPTIWRKIVWWALHKKLPHACKAFFGTSSFGCLCFAVSSVSPCQCSSLAASDRGCLERERSLRSLLDIVMNQEKKKKPFFFSSCLLPMTERRLDLIAAMSPSAPFYSSDRTASVIFPEFLSLMMSIEKSNNTVTHLGLNGPCSGQNEAEERVCDRFFSRPQHSSISRQYRNSFSWKDEMSRAAAKLKVRQKKRGGWWWEKGISQRHEIHPYVLGLFLRLFPKQCENGRIPLLFREGDPSLSAGICSREGGGGVREFKEAKIEEGEEDASCYLAWDSCSSVRPSPKKWPQARVLPSTLSDKSRRNGNGKGKGVAQM